MPVVAALCGSLLLAGCVYQPPVEPRYVPAPYAQQAPNWTPRLSGLPWHNQAAPYQPPLAPEVTAPHDTGPSFAHDAAEAGLTVGGIELAKRLFKPSPGVAALAPNTSGAGAGSVVGTTAGEAATAGAGAGAVTRATAGMEAATGAAGAARTAGAAAEAAELAELESFTWRGLVWLGEECVLVFCR